MAAVTAYVSHAIIGSKLLLLLRRQHRRAMMNVPLDSMSSVSTGVKLVQCCPRRRAWSHQTAHINEKA